MTGDEGVGTGGGQADQMPKAKFKKLDGGNKLRLLYSEFKLDPKEPN